MDKVRCLMLSSGIPKLFWGEAVNTVVYLINQSPSTATNIKSLMDIWSSSPPTLSHIRVFDCAAFAYQQESKLDPRSKKCVFLGYPNGVNGTKFSLQMNLE